MGSVGSDLGRRLSVDENSDEGGPVGEDEVSGDGSQVPKEAGTGAESVAGALLAALTISISSQLRESASLPSRIGPSVDVACQPRS